LLSSSNKKISYQINSINQATIFNSLIAVGCLELIGTNSSDGLEALKTLKTPKGRGNLINVEKNGIKFTIIDDSYNANSASMKAGLKFLSDLKKYKPNSRTIAFVGEMLELGEFNESEHKAIANYISNFNIDLVLLVGSSMQNLVSEIKPEKLIGSFPNSNFAAENIKFEPQDGDIIFAKGSRGTKMEKLIEKLL
ncbi:MAG: UDP-N-acetylmuramyl pentapeptide synthase, partial [Rickettsiales bacterium]